MNLLAQGERSYYARRIPVMIFILVLTAITASFSAGTANTFFFNALLPHVGPDIGTIAAASGALILEVGKFLIAGLFFYELYRLRYLDAILLVIGLSVIGFSLYVSTEGAKASEAAAKAARIEKQDSTEATNTTPPPVAAAAITAPKFQNTSEGSRHAYKFQEAKAQEAAAKAAQTAAELKKEELKNSQRIEADKSRNLFLKSNTNMIWILELLNLLFALCVGYIESTRPIENQDNEEVPEEEINDPEEVRIWKRDFATARSKAGNGDDKSAQRMEELKAQIIAMGEKVPEARAKKRRLGY